MKWLRWFLVFVPLAFLFEFVWYDPLLLSVCLGIALVPLAGLPGSSMQIALFVAPLLAFVSLLFGPEMTSFDVAALMLSGMLATMIAPDGAKNWLEGAQLLAVSLVFAPGFFYTGM